MLAPPCLLFIHDVHRNFLSCTQLPPPDLLLPVCCPQLCRGAAALARHRACHLLPPACTDLNAHCAATYDRSFAEERRRWPANARANWRELRRRLLGFKRRLRAERGESGSESESEDEAAVAARFGMQKVGAAGTALLWVKAGERRFASARKAVTAWVAAMPCHWYCWNVHFVLAGCYL